MVVFLAVSVCKLRKLGFRLVHDPRWILYQTLSASKGSTELWRALSALYLLDGTGSHSNPRNLFVISDGHVTEEANTLALIRGHCQGNRVFTLGVG